MLLVGFFGWPIAIAYVVVGLVLAVIGGTIIEKTGLGKYVEGFVLNGQSSVDIESPALSQNERAHLFARPDVADVQEGFLVYRHRRRDWLYHP
jgi:uncharacterized membrane protein YraQ (UPF0718 family)